VAGLQDPGVPWLPNGEVGSLDEAAPASFFDVGAGRSWESWKILVTVEDLEAYTRPFTVRLVQRLMPDGERIEMVCQENNRSIHHFVN
jgi:hypothetical protein